MRDHAPTFFALFMLAACTAPLEGGDGAQRGNNGKADAPGECTPATCGGAGVGSCYCDSDCATHDDCCANYEPVCVAGPASDDDAGGGASDAGMPTTASTVPEFGTDATRQVEVLATSDHGLNAPRDLEFNNARPDQLFIVNQGDDSVSIVQGFGAPGASIAKYAGPGGNHFCAKPAALAFGTPGIFATAQEEDDITQPSTPRDFMGPTLWDSALPNFDAGHRSHIDMLHNSPNAAGIAHYMGNAYFVFDGEHESITLYDFQTDHGWGGNDHSDGIVRRYAEGEVSYVPGVPSHLEVSGELVYIADTGNRRVAVLDPTEGSLGGDITPNFDGSDQRYIVGSSIETLVDGNAAGLSQPSGIAIHDGRIFVSDAADGEIVAFDMSGEELGRIDTGPAGIMGLTIGPDGDIYFINGAQETLGHVAP